MKIFLTGATGYLGYEVLRALLSRNHQITALVRSPKTASLPSDVELVEGAIENSGSYRQALQGQDVFVHIAALVKMWARDRKNFERINVDALQEAIRNAADAGLKKFIYTSSFIALGPSNGTALTEADDRRTNHFHNDYERSKHLGDQLARRFIRDGYPVTILYPGVIYGPGKLTDGNIIAKNVVPFLNRRMPFGLGIQVWCYAFIKDVVSGFLRVIEGVVPSDRYILGGENVDGRSFYQTLYEVTGKKPVFNIPMKMALIAGYGEYLLAQLFGREPSMLTHEVVEIYKRSWAYDSSHAIRELDYKITPLKDGLMEMVTWLKNAGLIR
ncbi:MAG TPA: NAD-dependent epimerase/dehydratase family protein [Acidobacteriota bacterium]|nr:NAD-dependent epimerase/dehydratase family protein [Acidobacteriota bacterium]